MTSTAPSTKRLESSTPSETAIRWPTTELLLSGAARSKSLAGPRRDTGRVGGVAGGPDEILHLARRSAATAAGAGVGQSGRPQDTRPGAVAVRAWGHAALHARGRQLVEHGRVDRACAQAPRAGRA